MTPTDGAETRPARRFRVPTATAMLALFIIAPLVITGAVNLHQFRNAYRTKVSNELSVMIERHSLTVDAFINDRLSDIRVIAREHPLERLRQPEFLRLVLNLMREEYHGAFVDLGLVSSDGIQVAYAGPFNLHMAEYSAAPWFQEAMASENFVSDVFAGLRGSPHFIVATQRKVGDELYVVKATIDFEAFNALVENLRIGSTGFAFIINREGEFQTNPRFVVALNRPPWIDLLEGRVRSDRISVLDGEDVLGRKAIFTIAPLKQGQWFLCYQQETSDAFTELRRVQEFAAVVLIIVSLAAIFAGYLLSRSLAQRLADAYRDRRVMAHQVIETGRLASIGELAAGIAHEINNPVAIMVQEAGWIDDLLGEGDPCSGENLEEIMRAVTQIRTQGDRCKEITYKLLSFARKTDPTIREVELNDVVDEVIGLTSQKTRYANVSIETELNPHLPAIHASPSELQQVLLNLVNNAIDAIERPGGTVTVATKIVGDKVVLEVRDTGKGIPEANLGRIFDPFFTTKPVGQGTGLGLPICYGIVEKMGGRITVESEIEKGTTFTVFIPREAPEGDNVESETRGDRS
ncbi:MAG: ATP-binding protein [Acidobacteriota bacterium]|jgi:two-component system NtrC family sensor kinase|nr:ATP-binding protein [Acidobacteriota bacterium]